ncbi:MAG: transcription antitermination factor NusB, partial [Acidobacteriota bacterium]
MGHRRQARELALQLLFQVEVTRDSPEEAVQDFWKDRDTEPPIRSFAEELTFGTLRHLREIDATLSAATEHWRLERMAIVDRNVLRMALFELTYQKDAPPAVIINEAIEVARRYGSGDSAGGHQEPGRQLA